MTTFVVNTVDDTVAADGKLSLREAVNSAADSDTIRFDTNLEGGSPLVLTGGQLTLGHDVTIDGDWDNNGSEVTISGNDASRIFEISGAATAVRLTDLTLTDGRAPDGASGGAILLGAGSLSLDKVVVLDSAVGDFGPRGGGLYAADGTRVDIRGGQFVANNGGYGDNSGGGAIATGTGVELAIYGSRFTQNQSSGEFSAGGGAIYLGSGGSLVMEDTVLHDNSGSFGGGLRIVNSTAEIARSSFTENSALSGGAIQALASDVSLNNTTVAGNSAEFTPGFYKGGIGGGIGSFDGSLVVRNSTITGNHVYIGPSASDSIGGGIAIRSASSGDIANSFVAGNTAANGSDVYGVIANSNGHNIFGSDVLGNVAGDREGIVGSTLFATGLVNADGVVVLRNSVTNPALSGALSLDSLGTDQLGHVHPQPSNSQPDIGAAELNQTLSSHASANNYVLTGTSAANTISGLAGNDRIVGLAGNATLNGGDGSDTFGGSSGNDKI